MPETLTLIQSKHDIASTSTASDLHYSISADLPTVSALANHIGLLDEEFSAELDLDVILSRRNAPRNGNGYWIRDAELAPAQRDRAAGGDSRLVALSLLEVSSPVVTLTSSGIRSAADLRGKRLGIVTSSEGSRDPRYAQQLKAYRTTLNAAGLTLLDIRFVPFEAIPSDAAATGGRDEKIKAALEAGKDIAQRLQRLEFDAIVVESASDIAHHASVRIIYDTVDHPDYLARAHPDGLRGIVVSSELLRERRDLVVRVLARLLQVAEWAKAHPRVAANALAGSLSFAGNFDELTGRYKNLSGGLQIDLGVEKILTLKAQKNYLLRHQLVSRDFDVDAWIDHGPLVEAHLLYAGWKKAERVREPLRRE